MWLVAGLGNPGAEYVGTRHNVGFEVIDKLAHRHNIVVQRRNFQAVFGDGLIGAARVMLVRPMTFMNLSGEAVGTIARFYKIDPAHIIVVLDEVALPVGQIRLRYQGSAGGHNGLASVIQRLQTSAVPRVRIGIGQPSVGHMAGHVLSRFTETENSVMREAYERAADAVECAVTEGFEMAMNRFNVRTEPRDPGNPVPKKTSG